MKITMAQLNPVVGDIDGNTSMILDGMARASKAGSDLVVFSELIVTGYPPKDLLEREAFIEQAQAALEKIAEASKQHTGLGAIVGCPVPTGRSEGKPLHNAALFVTDGRIVFTQGKLLLPTYDVFDEDRYFEPAKENAVFPFKGEKLGISVCEDFWNDAEPWIPDTYACDPIEMLAKKGATLLINISSSPFSMGKERVRYELIRNHAKEHRLPFVFVNQVGGNDDLVFDGRSLYVESDGDAREILPSFEEAFVTIDTKEKKDAPPYAFENEIKTVYKGLVLGTRDYVQKCGFSKVVIGLSGGIDSAVTTAIAVRALGAENVVTLAMPSPYTSKRSAEGAVALAKNLGVELTDVGISNVMAAYDAALKTHFDGRPRDATEENIQARIRGNILMAFSNKFGYLPLSTGNKSELAVGYCTLYGDMSGGLAVISDVPKTMVYELAHFINREKAVIPKRIIEKAPSAELKKDQKDQDFLPPYEILDEILERYIDDQWSFDDIVGAGFDEKTTAWVIDAVRKNEFKRKQAAPGLKVTSKAFGTGRRMPVAAKYDV